MRGGRGASNEARFLDLDRSLESSAASPDPLTVQAKAHSYNYPLAA